jgi:lipoprotein-anchoring transpeptidase ErfK/SrfK
VLNPQWTDPVTKETFAPSDPGNVLGGYWIALDASGLGRNGIGFHGYTGAPAQDWIAKPASHGCVRMLQRDIDRLYHLALEGTPVTIAE